MSENLISDEQFLQWLGDLRHEKPLVKDAAYKALLATMPEHFPTLFRLIRIANFHQQRGLLDFVFDIARYQKMSHPESVYLLIRHYSDTTHADLKMLIYNTVHNLLSVFDRHDLPCEMFEFFLHDDYRLRRMMVTLAMRVPSSRAVPYLITLLHDDDLNVHRISKAALQHSGSAQASLALAEWEKWHE